MSKWNLLQMCKVILQSEMINCHQDWVSHEKTITLNILSEKLNLFSLNPSVVFFLLVCMYGIGTDWIIKKQGKTLNLHLSA